MRAVPHRHGARSQPVASALRVLSVQRRKERCIKVLTIVFCLRGRGRGDYIVLHGMFRLRSTSFAQHDGLRHSEHCLAITNVAFCHSERE